MLSLASKMTILLLYKYGFKKKLKNIVLAFRINKISSLASKIYNMLRQFFKIDNSTFLYFKNSKTFFLASRFSEMPPPASNFLKKPYLCRL